MLALECAQFLMPPSMHLAKCYRTGHRHEDCGRDTSYGAERFGVEPPRRSSVSDAGTSGSLIWPVSDDLRDSDSYALIGRCGRLVYPLASSDRACCWRLWDAGRRS